MSRSRKHTRSHNPRFLSAYAHMYQPGEPLRVRNGEYWLMGRWTRNRQLAIDWWLEIEKRMLAAKRQTGSWNLDIIEAEVNRLFFRGEEEAS